MSIDLPSDATRAAHLGITSADDDRYPQATPATPPTPADPGCLGSTEHSELEAAEGDPVMARDELCTRLADALAGCPNLRATTRDSETLWLALREAVCTRSRCNVVPLGASAPVEVTEEYAGQELAEAMVWLRRHEHEARCLPPVLLFRRLRAAATRGANGSARMAQQDSLHGVTGVVPGQPVAFVSYGTDAVYEVEAS